MSRGFALAELLVATVLAGVILGAACRLLLDTQRALRDQSEVLAVQDGIHAAAAVLEAELRPLDARAGDLVAVGADSVTLRALRLLQFVCAEPPPGSRTLTVRADPAFGWRAADSTRDRALVFSQGDPETGDARWLDVGIAATGAAGRCDDGTPGSQLVLAATPAAAVGSGAPVRVYELVTYRLYADEQGESWLGVRGRSSGGWSAISPVAGPLRPQDGLAFAWHGADGQPVASPLAVARVDIVVRGLGTEPLRAPGRALRGSRYRDSLAVCVRLRNVL